MRLEDIEIIIDDTLQIINKDQIKNDILKWFNKSNAEKIIDLACFY